MLLFFPIGWAPEKSDALLSRYPRQTFSILPGLQDVPAGVGPLLDVIYGRVASRRALPEEIQQNRFGLIESLMPLIGCSATDPSFLSLLWAISAESRIKLGWYSGNESLDVAVMDESFFQSTRNCQLSIYSLGAIVLCTSEGRQPKRFTTLFLCQTGPVPDDIDAPFGGELPRGLRFFMSREEVRTLVGEPSRTGAQWDRWDQSEPNIHCQYSRRGLCLVTLMVPG